MPGCIAGAGLLDVDVTDDPLPVFAEADGVLDFTAPPATVDFAALAAQARIVHVVGTTGLQEDDFAKLEAAARHARIVQSGNMSLGVNLLAGLVRKVAATLGEDFDIEILEMHHRHEGRRAVRHRAPSRRGSREGPQDRARRRVRCAPATATPARDARAISALRRCAAARSSATHRVIFAGPGERLELSHRAEDRSLFARGALKAALWAFDKKPGYYTMADVLGLSRPLTHPRPSPEIRTT